MFLGRLGQISGFLGGKALVSHDNQDLITSSLDQNDPGFGCDS